MSERPKGIFAPFEAVFDGEGEPDLPMIEPLAGTAWLE